MMEFVMTKGFILFLCGLVGMALAILLGFISSVVLHGSYKKTRQKLDEIYKI